MEKLDLLNPHELYTKSLKNQHIKNAEAYFDALVSTSKVDVELNKNTVKKLNERIKERDVALKREKGMEASRIWLIILVILSFIAGIVLITLYFTEHSALWHILVGIGCFALAVFSIVMICTKINP